MPCLIGPTGTPTAVFPCGFMGLKLLSISHTEQLLSGPPEHQISQKRNLAAPLGSPPQPHFAFSGK